MRKIFFKSMLLLCTLVVGSTSLWADPAPVNTELWKEDWTGATTATSGSNSATPSANYGKGTTVYNSGTVTYTQSANTVYVRNENTGGGTAPELLLSSGKTWTISDIPTGGATELTLTYVSNNTKSSVSCSTDGASISGSSKSYTITTGGAETITLVFSCSGNTRIDNVVLKVKIAGGDTRTPIATDVSITDPGSLTVGASGTFEGVSTDATNACTKTWTSDNSSVIEITNSATGAYNAAGRGVAKITYTITPQDATTYSTVSAESSFTVTTPVVITASDVEMTYGDAPKAIGATTSSSDGYTGSLSYTSANEAVVTVDGNGEITAVAAGVTTIRIRASANAKNYYTASTKDINVIVNQPAGGSTAKPSTEVIALDFTDNSEWDFPSGNTQKTTSEGSFTADGYTVTLAGGGTGNGYYFNTTDKYLLMGKTDATLTLPAFSYPVTQIEVVGRTGASGKVTQNIYVGETAVSTETTGSTGKNTYEISSSYQAAGTIYTLKVTNDNNTQITAINVTIDKGEATIPVTLNADGYATFCSEYPLDFSDYATADFSAWQITSVENSTITFSQITGNIKGGQGILLKGDPNAIISINSENSTNVLTENKLVGCLAPTYVGGDARNYALVHVNTAPAHSEFQNLGSYNGIMPAGKAYLRIPGQGGQAPSAFRIVFEENNATNIENLDASETAVKFIENGQLFIKKNGVVYDAVGRVIRK